MKNWLQWITALCKTFLWTYCNRYTVFHNTAFSIQNNKVPLFRCAVDSLSFRYRGHFLFKQHPSKFVLSTVQIVSICRRFFHSINRCLIDFLQGSYPSGGRQDGKPVSKKTSSLPFFFLISLLNYIELVMG